MIPVDPRLSVIESRLSRVDRILAVGGGKGGVGKSLASAVLALTLADGGKKIGLLDLDLSTPSQHVILGAGGLFPKEERGIVPPVVNGVALLSLAYFLDEEAAPMRGADVSNIIVELLAITQWGGLDFLIVDLPPGLGDAVLDVLRLMRRAESLLVTIPSKVAFAAAERSWELLKGLDEPVLGLLENMRREEPSALVTHGCSARGIPYIGALPYDSGLEAALGDSGALLRTAFAGGIRRAASTCGLL